MQQDAVVCSMWRLKGNGANSGDNHLCTYVYRIMWASCPLMYVCVFVCLSVCQVNHECVDWCQPNLVGMVDPVGVVKFWCWSDPECWSVITFPLPLMLRDSILQYFLASFIPWSVDFSQLWNPFLSTLCDISIVPLLSMVGWFSL